MSEQEMRGEILALVRAYCEKYHAPKEDFSPGDRLPYAARVYDHEEMEALVDSSLEFWLTAGRYAAQFEKGLAA
ncbi:MAG: lipopolysaccharide biosynthesis protein RfbH, partial [Selenomonas sp.]|nr:lipopolysaccharide biosynthesis protein RfbH [Selenomonas sp.]